MVDLVIMHPFLKIKPISEIGSLVKGEISREEFQRKLKENYQTHEERR